MPNSNTPYFVTGSWERDPRAPAPTGIVDHAEFASLTWEPVTPNRPNRVRTFFASKPPAQALFDAMRTAGLDVHKSWL